MPVAVRQIHPVFAGEVSGVDIAKPISPEDVAALTNQMVRLANDSALRDQLRTAGLWHAQRFHWQHPAAATLAVYARAVARTRRPGEALSQTVSRADSQEPIADSV